MIRSVAAAAALLLSLPLVAQTVDFDVLVDTDRNPGSGCSVTPSGGAPLGGFEQRIRASVDLASLEVVALARASCSGAAFGPPIAISDFPVPYPLALNTATSGGDAVELAVATSVLGLGGLRELRLAFVADNGTTSDVLSTVDGSASGGPILFGLPVQIPALSIWGLGALVLILLGLAFVAHRRMGRVGAVMAVALVATAVWAMNFAPDGDLADWSGRGPIANDPSGDTGNPAVDLLAGFVALDGGALFFRMDVGNIENQAPVANNDAYATDEDTPLSIAAPGVLANDSDPESDPLTAVLDTGVTDGTLTFNTDGSFDYTPDPDFNGSDAFTYFANDGQADSVAATVTITVNALNDPPVANDDTATTSEDTQIDIDVLANDSDVDGNLDPASVNVTSGPANGTTSVDPTTGVITYTKSGDFNGSDAFVYEVCDDGTPLPVECANAAVSITVDPVNDPPIVADDSASTDEDTAVDIDVLANDSDSDGALDPATVMVASAPANGGTSVNLTTGAITYTPNADFNGSDAFTYQVCDDGTPTPVECASATVTITVNSVNDAPIVDDDSASTDEDTAVDIDVLANDSDVDGALDPASVNVTSGPANGGTGVNLTTGAVTYTPDADFNGSDAFTYQVCDDGAPTPVECASATVTITVNAVNDAPTFNNAGDVNSDEDAGAQTEPGWASSIDDGDGATQSLTFNITNNTNAALFSAGPAVDATSGDLTYTAASDANGSAMITLVLTDDGGTPNGGADTSAPETFTITVNPVDDPPVAVDDTATVTEDAAATPISVLSNDTDIDGGPISIASVTQPTNGTVVITGGGSGLTYQPDPDYCNDGGPTDGFFYTLSPGGSSADVSVTVTCQNDAPVIAFPSGSTAFNNTGPVVLDASATLSDVDSTDFDTGDLTVSLALSADSSMCDVLDTLTVENQGMGAGQIGFNGTDVSFEGTIFGTVTTPYLCTDSGGGMFDIQPLLITFDPNASQAAVTALLRALQYNTTSTDDQDREASAMVTDGDGGTSNAAATTVTVNLNQAPEITSDGGGATAMVNAAENQTAVTTVTATDADIPAQTLTFSITGGADQALFSIGSSSGVLTFDAAPDFENPVDAGMNNIYDVQVTVSDDGTPPLDDVQDISVTVTDVNDGPTITSDGGGATAMVNAAENQTAVTTVTATDADLPAQTLTFSITGGADQALFSIGSSSGVLTFNSAPDFENPVDSGMNNIYDVQVTVADDGMPALDDVQDIAVTVTDVNEAPTAVNESFAAQSNVGVAPDAMNGLLVNGTDPDSGDSLSLAPASVGTFATTAGGSITTLADGSFTYTPQAGDAGVMDTFAYTVQDDDGLTDSATVTFNVDSNTIWFVDLDAGTTGDGTLNNPFDSLADLDNGGPDADGSTIFHYSSTMGTQTDALGDDFDLQASQLLIGEGAPGTGTINNLRGFTTHPHSPTLPSIGAAANHTITSSANGGITLATGNTISGIDIGNTVGSGISGTSFGTFTVEDVLIGGTGQALDLDTGSIAGAGFTSVSSSSGTRNVSLDAIGGTLDLGGGSLSGASAQAFFVDGGTGTVSYSGSISNAASRVAEIQNKTGGAVTLSGPLNSTGTGIRAVNNSGGTTITFSGASKVVNTGTDAAVTLSSNTGATINFANGGLDIDTTSGTGFSATSGGTVNVTGAGNTIDTAGTAVNIINTLVGGSGVSFASTTSTGGADGIRLTNVGAGAFTTNGGSLTNQTDRGVDVSGGSGNITIGATISTTSTGRSVEVTTHTGGTVDFNGFIDDNGLGIRMENNVGAILRFDGGMDIDTAAAVTEEGFQAIGGGTVHVTGTNDVNTSAGTGVAVNIAGGTVLGSDNVTFRNVSADGAANGIVLDTTGSSGGLTVTGDGSTAGSGGTLENIIGDAVVLSNTGGPVSLSYMTIQDIGNMGVIDSEHDAIHGQTVNGGLVLDNMTIRRISDMAIHGAAFPSGDSDTTWTGLTITNSTIQDTNRYHVAGAGDTSDEGSVRIRGLSGTALIDGNVFQDGAEHLDLFATAGTLNLTVTGNDFFESYKEFTSGGIASVGKMCVDLTVQGAADATVVIGDPVNAALGNNFRNCRIASVRIGNDSLATGTVTTTTANNDFLVTDHSSGIGGDFDFPMGGVKYSTRGATNAVFNGRISNNTFTDVTNADGGVGNVTLDMDLGEIQVLVDGNTFHAPGNAAWFVRADGTSSFDLLFENNIYQRDMFPCTTDPSCGGGYFGPGLYNRTQAQNGAVLDVTYRDEAFAQHDTFFDPGNTVEVQALNVGGGGTVCASFTGNSSPHGYALEESAGDLNLFAGASAVTGTCPTANCVTVLDDNMNTGGGGNPAADPPTVSVFGTIDIVSSACSLPSGGIF